MEEAPGDTLGVMAGPLNPSTLGDFRRDGMTLSVHCEDCRHHARLELDVLAARLGWAFDFYRDRPQLDALIVCDQCGSRKHSWIVGVPTGQMTVWPAALDAAEP